MYYYSFKKLTLKKFIQENFFEKVPKLKLKNQIGGR